MVASILIIIFSLVLLVYWFRYSCMMLLRNQAETAVSPATQDARFQVAGVQAGLNAGSALDPLHAALQRDYALLSYLVQHAAGLELDSIEDRLLVLDYRLMQGWFRVTRVIAPAQARTALAEMATVVGVLAGKIDQRAAGHTA
jgi:hypothetical protein